VRITPPTNDNWNLNKIHRRRCCPCSLLYCQPIDMVVVVAAPPAAAAASILFEFSYLSCLTSIHNNVPSISILRRTRRCVQFDRKTVVTIVGQVSYSCLSVCVAVCPRLSLSVCPLITPHLGRYVTRGHMHTTEMDYINPLQMPGYRPVRELIARKISRSLPSANATEPWSGSGGGGRP